MTPSSLTGVIAPSDIKVGPDGRFVYVVDATNNVSQFSINLDGTLTAGAKVPTGAGARTITIDATGHFAYASNSTDGTISQYSIDSAGVLHPLSVPNVAAGVSPLRLVLSPDGMNLYCANYSFNSPTISQFAVGEDGSLSPLTSATVAAYPYPVGMAFSPDGAWFYVSMMGGQISQFRRDKDGALSLMSTVDVGPTHKPWRLEIR